MSHFTVLCRLPSTIKFEDLESEVEKLLARYDENEFRDDFTDHTEEVLEGWESGTWGKVRLPDGKLVNTYDDVFRVPGTFGLGGGSHVVPDHLERVQVPYRDLYADIETFAKDYHGYEVERAPDATPERPLELGAPASRRFGYYTNKQGKWDWYQIGGRWRGKIPHVQGTQVLKTTEQPSRFSDRKWEPECAVVTCDGCRLIDVDWAEVERRTDERMSKVYVEWIEMLGGKKFDSFDGPRSELFKMGLIECFSTETEAEKIAARAAEGWTVKVWGSDTHSPGIRADVFAPAMSVEAFRDKYRNHFYALRGYASLDAEGWHEPGKMGWFGCAGGDPDDHIKYDAQSVAALHAGDRNDWIVMVDCHV